MNNWVHGWVNVCVGCLLAVAWAYGRLSHARGPQPIGLRALRHARGPAGPLLTKKQRTHFTQPYIPPPIYSPTPSIHQHLHSPTHPFIHPSIHPHIHSPTHSFIYPSIHP